VDNSAPREDHSSASEFSVTNDEVTCQQFVELITDYFEGALAPRTIGQVEEHLVMCDWCVTYLEQMELMIASLQELRKAGPPEPPVALIAALHSRASGNG
jgi:predicted anti-sigma-YlaC factor YlaD